MGLKIISMKMVWVDKTFAEKHYPMTRKEFLIGMGEKTLKTYEKYGKDPKEDLGTKDAYEIGKMINSWNMEFLTSVVWPITQPFPAMRFPLIYAPCLTVQPAPITAGPIIVAPFSITVSGPMAMRSLFSSQAPAGISHSIFHPVNFERKIFIAAGASQTFSIPSNTPENGNSVRSKKSLTPYMALFPSTVFPRTPMPFS